jgi:hypothetical protein
MARPARVHFPPELREALQIGFPVAAPANERRDSGPLTVRKEGGRPKVVARIGKRRFRLPDRLGRRWPIRERTYTHAHFVDWHDTSVEGVAKVKNLMWDRQRELLTFWVEQWSWPREWGPPITEPDALADAIAEHLPTMPQLVPLDSRTCMASGDEGGLPVFQYWFGEELHLHAFDLMGSLAGQAGILPPLMVTAPRWTFWSQFAFLDDGARARDSETIRRQHDALVAYFLGSEHPDRVYRSFHHLYGDGEGDPDLDQRTGSPRWRDIVEAALDPPAPDGFDDSSGSPVRAAFVGSAPACRGNYACEPRHKTTVQVPRELS